MDINGPQSMDNLLAGLAKSGDGGLSGLANVGNQASRFLLHSLQVPESFNDGNPGTTMPTLHFGRSTAADPIGGGKAWDLSLYANSTPVGTV